MVTVTETAIADAVRFLFLRPSWWSSRPAPSASPRSSPASSGRGPRRGHPERREHRSRDDGDDSEFLRPLTPTSSSARVLRPCAPAPPRPCASALPVPHAHRIAAEVGDASSIVVGEFAGGGRVCRASAGHGSGGEVEHHCVRGAPGRLRHQGGRHGREVGGGGSQGPVRGGHERRRRASDRGRRRAGGAAARRGAGSRQAHRRRVHRARQPRWRADAAARGARADHPPDSPVEGRRRARARGRTTITPTIATRACSSTTRRSW